MIAAGKADPARLFYGGWSWGGYLAAFTLGHTDRYRAIVVGAGVVDVVLQYVTSDINHGATADWEYKGRVPFVNAQILYRALTDRGVPVTFWSYPREPHGFQEPAHVQHLLDTWATFFDERLPPP